jgi:alpha-galactosidase
MLFPSLDSPATALELSLPDEGLPLVLWTDRASRSVGASGRPDVLHGPAMPLLGEHWRESFTRPHLRGYRLTDDLRTGRDWSPRFLRDEVTADAQRLQVTAHDPTAELVVLVEFETVPGGALRGRCTVTNTGPTPYVVEGLEVVLPLRDDLTEVLDFTGRHEGERVPQRHPVTDGLWLRETRGGRTGLEAPTMVIAGEPGFSFTRGRVLGVHVGWSGNAVLRLERDSASGPTIGAGELLQPGEVALGSGASYATPWVYFAAADGLDELAECLHAFQRSLPAHPTVQPVVLNVWEAVWFDHDVERLREIANRAARVGVERFVLDDGWFRHRRDDRAGLGDWWVDDSVWPQGLDPLVDHVRSLGMEFGLWFEPEMVNPDSDLHRAHPDWILATGSRQPLLHRHQLVLDLTRPEVTDFLFERVDAILSSHDISYVKWDHNRELLDGGSAMRGGAPSLHEQTRAFYRLLDALRGAHPSVAWESCASGGGRIDLGVIERVQRVWTSDVTDALARQQIQRWTGQLIAPEYLGAHVSAPVAHATGRAFPLDFRAATAMFGAFGIEWDLTTADDAELDHLAEWVARHKRFRPLLHGGRVVRPESSDPAVLLHGVVATDGSSALLAHVQIDESTHNRGVSIRVPRLDPEASYQLHWEAPVSLDAVSRSVPLPEVGPTGGVPLTGRALATLGLWIPRRRPHTVTLVRVERV